MDAKHLLQSLERVFFQNALDWDSFLQLGHRTHTVHSWIDRRTLKLFDVFVESVDSSNASFIMHAIYLESKTPLSSSARYLQTLVERVGVSKEYIEAASKLLLALSNSSNFHTVLDSLRVDGQKGPRVVSTIVQRECQRLMGLLQIF